MKSTTATTTANTAYAEVFIGTDLVSVPRIAQILQRYEAHFTSRVFTPRERHYCESKAAPAIHYAGRFAAKEALKKALLASTLVETIPFLAIEIRSREDGAPTVNLDHPQAERWRCQVSISHTADQALAMARIEVT